MLWPMVISHTRVVLHLRNYYYIIIGYDCCCLGQLTTSVFKNRFDGCPVMDSKVTLLLELSTYPIIFPYNEKTLP